MTRPVISVVIPARNAAATLAKQLEALADQSYAGVWELLIADNGSTDRTREIAVSFADRLPLRVVDASARPGVGSARNVGAYAAQGEFIAFCDADDVVDRDWLAAVAAVSDRCDAFGGRLEGASEGAGWRSAEQRGLPDGGDLAFLPYAPGANCGVRADVLRALDGFSERYRYAGDDTEFFWRLQLRGHRLCYADDAVVRYRYRAGTRSLVSQFYRYGRSHAQLYREFRGAGMPRSSLAEALGFWLRVPRHLPTFLRGSSRRDHLIAEMAKRLGRVAGSIRYRVLYV